MPSLSQLPGEIKRKKLTKALTRLGFVINEKGGDGSHYKALWPSTQKSITIPQNVNKYTLYYLLKEIESASGMVWEDIQKEL
ncbi:MAG: type II toxin-antitoxin system HicA family toxin [Patescibacteria group bacterium]|nr:type II toxin-antitoxin system HicA family toxin [Patescibacteria group bacterium]